MAEELRAFVETAAEGCFEAPIVNGVVKVLSDNDVTSLAALKLTAEADIEKPASLSGVARSLMLRDRAQFAFAQVTRKHSCGRSSSFW